jgi:hypothetical protein
LVLRREFASLLGAPEAGDGLVYSVIAAVQRDYLKPSPFA